MLPPPLIEQSTAKPVTKRTGLQVHAGPGRHQGDPREADLAEHGQSARAEQNGKKKEFLRALADERAELSFLLKQDDDDADLRRYSAASTRSALSCAAIPQSAASSAIDCPSHSGWLAVDATTTSSAATRPRPASPSAGSRGRKAPLRATAASTVLPAV